MNHLSNLTRARRYAKAVVVGSSLTLLPIAAAVAQTLPPGMAIPGSTDIQEVVRQALATNPEVQAAWSGLRAAGHDVGVARGNYLPSLDVAAGVGREYREGDGRGSYETSFAELTLSQMIYDGFATRSEVERLDRAKLVRYYELLGASESVALEAARAYLDVSRYRDLVRLAQENYVEHERVFDQIEERVRSGAGRGVDLQQISGRLALAESNLMTEASNLHDVTSRYQRIVGQLPAENLAPTPELDDRLPPSVAEAVDMAFQGNPEFHAAIENIEATRAEQDGSRAAFQPRLDLRGRTGTYDSNDGNFDPLGRRDRHSIELVASMNLYRGGSDLASFRAASDRLEQAVNQREQACHNIRQTTQIAYNDTRRLREQVQYLNDHRQSIDRVRGAYQQQFDIGERTLLDVLDSENEYFEASRAYVNAEYDIALADARTLAAMGQLMQTLGVMRDDMPTLAELGSDGVEINPEVICPVEGPAGFTLQDLIGGVSAPAPTRAPDVTLSADALFAINSAELSDDARGELDALVAQIGNIDNLQRIFIAGHADITGTDAINDPLSQRRADSVASYLVSQGVDAGLIETRGYGSRRPVASNETVEGRRQNRRVEVTLERNGEMPDMTFKPPVFDAAGHSSQPASTGQDVSQTLSLSSELDTRETERPDMSRGQQAGPQEASSTPVAGSYLQVMALRDGEQASLLKEELAASTAYPVSLVTGGNLHRVRLGPVDPDIIADLQREMENRGYPGAYVVNG
ncbi:TolC family outer membrane protein [Halomonas campisalis]|uniref:TolC family outer membrane protein n=1 Tax=Billgrantia campisalis TaxID=74661 RepID=A0ABS9P301_9GAMM|nr:TolC family outer membrane protein [Halomonas campisalis]MCG6656168.1 TolC family outer membrane protein [Halomonas campisalis]MDR5861354.1 TolC family outer membrane protein [Halomonas campisalis]